MATKGWKACLFYDDAITVARSNDGRKLTKDNKQLIFSTTENKQLIS